MCGNIIKVICNSHCLLSGRTWVTVLRRDYILSTVSELGSLWNSSDFQRRMPECWQRHTVELAEPLVWLSIAAPMCFNNEAEMTRNDQKKLPIHLSHCFLTCIQLHFWGSSQLWLTGPLAILNYSRAKNTVNQAGNFKATFGHNDHQSFIPISLNWNPAQMSAS